MPLSNVTLDRTLSGLPMAVPIVGELRLAAKSRRSKPASRLMAALGVAAQRRLPRIEKKKKKRKRKRLGEKTKIAVNNEASTLSERRRQTA
ncbi:unnamed protein product [Soboliphyme baturini]|uniref:Uncharacterized protein n=1 Tax=Soboliphyme baturini TaxID=241478 RepID=A0A183IW72_9BILA|nr:unnamed protein product [Soboliphyme baturini]